MTERIRRTWRRTTPFAKLILALVLVFSSGAVLVYALDNDNNGIDDSYEAFFGLVPETNGAALDYDNDGLDNLAESLLWTDPLIADTDRDGLPDGADSNAVSRAWIPWGEPLFSHTSEVVYTWPPWMVSAFRNGGEWQTNPCAWHVPADDTNGADLNIEFDRQLLTNDLVLRMGYVDHSNASIFVDLYDTNETVIASNLFGNLLTGSGTGMNRVLNFPLETVSNAAGIRLRRGTGEVTVLDSLLYVDRDGDGLDADQERQLGTSDTELDSDHDGFSDFEEAFTYGTDPASSLSVPYGAIAGQVFYQGVQTGVVHLVAAPDATTWPASWTADLAAPGSYVMFAPQRQTYFVKAYRDVNGNGEKDSWEPCGTAIPLTTYLQSATTGGIDVAMSDPDSDGDGMSDVAEMRLGTDPSVWNAYARLPFVENFETNTVQEGDINGQNGWMASPANAVVVQAETVWEGRQALQVNSVDVLASARQCFAVTNAPVVWADMHVQAFDMVSPTNAVTGSAAMFFDANGYLEVYDGLSTASNKWLALTNLPPQVVTGQWVRLTTRLDYVNQQWLVCVDGTLAASGLGFATPASGFIAASVKGTKGGLDALAISTNEPAGLDIDLDGLPDDWEIAHFGNNDQGSGEDPDHDGLTNLREYELQTDPANADTDGDGMPDGWESAYGLNPVAAADAVLDADGDGYANLAEYRAGTDPTNAASHCWSVTGEVAYGGPQTGHVWVVAATAPDGGEVAGSVSMQAVGGYAIGGLPPNSNYWIRAWVDVNGNGTEESWEAHGTCASNPVVLHSDLSGINLTLADSDSDGDGMPDWWEMAHGLDLGNAADAGLDADGDGLGNLVEYRHGTDPALTDTDHDGITDAGELGLGTDPSVWNAYARLPFVENFETNTVQEGDINGQNGWMASPANAVVVQAETVWEGRQALQVNSADVLASARQCFAVTNAPVVWADMHVQAFDMASPTNAVTGSAAMFFDANGYLEVYDGLSTASNKWLALTNLPPQAVTGQWVRLTTRLDYLSQQWLVCVDGTLAATGLGFATPASGFIAASVKGRMGGMDALCIGTEQPAGLSLDGDRLPDDWEMAHFGNLAQMDGGDPDGDGVSNLEEYRHGTDPNAADSDGDGMPDGWEIAHGLDPANMADAALDGDGDGLSAIQEFVADTDPRVADTDHDGLGDGEELNTWHSNPLAVDSDGDGYADGDEVAQGANPADADSYPASQWLNHSKLMFRDGVMDGTLGDVPVLVKLTPERIDYSQCLLDGRDVYFTDSRGAPLAFEMEQWSPGGDSFIWVRLPQAGANPGGHFWLHWNNPAATNAADAAAVWGADSLAVWHLSGTNTLMAGSAPGACAATNMGAVSVTGLLGNALNFRGNDSLIVPPAALTGISNQVTVSFWQYGAATQPRSDFFLEGTSAAGRELGIYLPWNNSIVYWDAFGNSDRITRLAATNLYRDGWNYWAFTKDAASGVMTIHVNGELWQSGTGKTRAYTPVTACRFGASATGLSCYHGQMDEIRIESVARSTEWIRFQYQSMHDDVLVYGAQQVSLAVARNGSEPGQAGELVLQRTASCTNLPLVVNLSAPTGTATEGADFAVLPRAVTIPAGATQAAIPVPVIDDLWLEGTETATVSIVRGNYFISPAGAAADLAIIDDDVDSDNDGLCDAWEMQHFGNLDMTASGDADSDGVDNLHEYLNRTDPRAGDTDQDGLPDAWETGMGTDPLVPDAGADPDNDGLTNLQEFQLGTNPHSADTDGDGMPDKWERDNGLDPLVNDAALDPDGDGLSNLREYQHGANPHNPDTDGDTLGDGTEVDTCGTSPSKADSDDDGLPDKWEIDHGLNPLSAADALADTDGDGLPDAEELYFLGSDPESSDGDLDGIPDMTVDVAMDGTNTVRRTGQWTEDGGTLIALSNRNIRAEYAVAITNADMYRVTVLVTNTSALATNSYTFRVNVQIDQTPVGWISIPVAAGTNAWGTLYTPWLSGREHVVRLAWLDDGNIHKALGIQALLLERIHTAVTNANGRQDWVNRILDAGGDTDGDGLADREELDVVGTDPLLADTDGDTLGDGEERTLFGTDPLRLDSQTNGIPDATVQDMRDGVVTSAREQWHIWSPWVERDAVLCNVGGDANASYDFTVAVAGMYRLGLQLRNVDDDPPDDYRFKVQVSVDGISNGVATIFADMDLSGSGYVMTPWLAPGIHRFTLKWMNNMIATGRAATIGIEKVRLYELNALDTNTNGVQDWMETLLQRAGDSDGDGLGDQDEVIIYHTNPLLVDSDGDGVNDDMEIRLGIDPNRTDSDDDGLDDGAEVYQAFSDPAVADFDGTFVAVQVHGGGQAQASTGNWTVDGSNIFARERSGTLDYGITVATSGYYAVAVDLTQHNALTEQNAFDLACSVDGVMSGRQVVQAPYGFVKTATFFLPRLDAGLHTIRLRWINSLANTFLQVNAVRLLSFGGDDADLNGNPDWLDHRLARLSDFTSPPQTSVVSPLCIEGQSAYPSMLSVAVSGGITGEVSQTLSVTPGVGANWYADVSLAPTGSTSILVHDENGAVTSSNLVEWVPLELSSNPYTNGLVLRKDSTVSFGMRPPEAGPGVVTFVVYDAATNALTNAIVTAEENFLHQFEQSGDYRVVAAFSNELCTSNAEVAIRSVSATFPADAAICVRGQSRNWVCPGIPADVVIETDPELSVISSNLTGGGVGLTLRADDDVEHRLVARLGAGGPVLDSARIVMVTADHGDYVQVVETFPDGSRMIEVRLQLGAVPANLNVELDIFVGGVLFLDGSRHKVLTAADFNEVGVCTYRMIQSASTHTSVCHTTKIYDGAEYVGGN